MIKNKNDLVQIGLNIKIEKYNLSFLFGNISRLCIDKKFRGFGMSKVLDKEKLNLSKNLGVKLITAKARLRRAEGLKR